MREREGRKKEREWKKKVSKKDGRKDEPDDDKKSINMETKKIRKKFIFLD